VTAFLDTVERGFSGFLGALIGVVALSIGLIAFAIPLNLLLVKMHWGNLWWLHEAIEYALYVGVFIGAPWVLQQGAHVRVDILLSNLPKKAAVWLERFVDVSGLGLCLALCYYGIRMCISEFQDGTLPDKDLRIPTGYMMMVFASSFFLLGVEFALRLRRRAQGTLSEQAPSGI
jgi:TRAP-type C4-dicarboxylate transport system permease small subunit